MAWLDVIREKYLNADSREIKNSSDSPLNDFFSIEVEEILQGFVDVEVGRQMSGVPPQSIHQLRVF